MRFLFPLVACFLVSCGSGGDKLEPIRILFVGNSLTYVGNLPAVLDALSSAGGRPTASDMIVAPGGTLTDRLKDGSVSRALSEGRYDIVVLQERGGDFACGFGQQVCVDALAALESLSESARKERVSPLLLGTYQGHPQASRSIVEAEFKAAEEVGVDYVSVSDRLQELRSKLPDMAWFAADGMHPGSDLTLLNALLLYERIHGLRPSAVDISVSAPIYTYMSPVAPVLISASAATGTADVPMRHDYQSDRIAALVENLW